jgi:hypothetical protein
MSLTTKPARLASLKLGGALLLCIGLLGGELGDVASASAGGKSPVVLELFTSQGCSSCPPADEYLGELAARGDVIPLAFHVDYWNYIGWTDPYATKEMTKRQKDYARSLNQRYVYTPEMVVNGTAQEAGSNRHGIETLIAAAKAEPNDGPTVDLKFVGADRIHAHIGAGAAQAGPATVWLVKFDRPHQTSVEHGENKGRTLTDYQTVRTFEELATWTGAPLDLDYAAYDPNDPGNGGCALIVQRDGTGPIIAAAMLKFPKAGS